MSVAAANAYYDDTALLDRQAIAMVMRLWASVDISGIGPSWTKLLPQAWSILVAAETVAAELADPYLSEMLDDAMSVVSPGGMVRSGLQTLLYQPVFEAKASIASGLAANLALERAGRKLSTYVHTGTGDTARLAVTAGMAARPHAGGYYRMLRPPSCARCAILAGRFYKWNRGFKRHPRCFPAGTAVSGPATSAATRRWYEGELVVFATASGQELSLTGNHPVLTSRGWVPANLLHEGDEVVRSTEPKGATPLVVPDHHQMPSLIEDVWRSLGMAGSDRMPTTTEDFHGDGQDGEVDVVWANSALSGHGQATVDQHVEECLLARRLDSLSPFSGECAAHLLDLRDPPHSRGAVGGLGLEFPFLGSHLGHPYVPSFAGGSSFDASLGQSSGNNVAGHPVLRRQPVLAGAGPVGGNDRINWEFLDLPRWDAPGDSFSVETAEGYTARGRDLLDRLSGQVELDRVIQLRRVQWRGHVYSLTSSEGWHVANSLIVSNCDCVHIPTRGADNSLRFNPREAIEAGEVTGLSKNELKAIRLGANPSQVVNARQGMYDSGQFQYTTTGTTRQGVAGARILAKDIDRALGLDVSKQTYTNVTLDRQAVARYAELFRQGKTYTRLTKTGREQQYAYRFVRTPRPTPSQIIASAGSRSEAVRLLTNYGYII